MEEVNGGRETMDRECMLNSFSPCCFPVNHTHTSYRGFLPAVFQIHVCNEDQGIGITTEI